MTKKIVIPCVIGGQVEPVDFFVGKPAEGTDPIHFQSKWLNSSKKGTVPQHIISALLELQKVSTEAGVSFEDLCDMTFNPKNQVSNQTKPTETKEEEPKQ